MLRVAEMAIQIAAAEAHENSGRTAMEAFALEGIEYFVDLEHYVWIASSFLLAMTQSVLIKVLWGFILDVGSLVVARLPHIGAVAVRDSVDNPLGQVLGSRVEVQHLVDVGMVNLSVNQTFDFGKIAHHAIAVKFLGAAIHIDFPVVAVQVLAFALIVEVKLMAGGYF